MGNDDNYKATIVIDALKKHQESKVARQVRALAIRTKTITGDNEENSVMLRLADAIAGFVRAYTMQKKDYITLFEKAVKEAFKDATGMKFQMKLAKKMQDMGGLDMLKGLGG